MTDRLDLDRVELADIVGPSALAAAIHRQLGQQTGAVAIDAVAYALDITQIRRVEFDGCEGVLLTDRQRNYGQIAVNIRGGLRRARFSIAHELGHFLLENHALSRESGFICSRDDMGSWGGLEGHQRQENEANRFAIELLAPAHLMKVHFRGLPDLLAAVRARAILDLSLEAVMRRYVELCDQPVAAVMTQGRIVRYSVRGNGFPWVKLRKGDRLPPMTAAHRAIVSGSDGVGELVESFAAAWLEDSDVELFEQTRLGADGFAITLLWAATQQDEDTGEAKPLHFGRRRR